MDDKKRLEELNEKFKGDISILGKSILTAADKNSAPRILMFSSHIDQAVQINKPEIPYFSYGRENTVGKHSDSYRRMDDESVVVDKIVKFPDYQDSPYILVIYNKNTNKYDIIIKEIMEDLTESYCYLYDNSTIDKLQVGDTIPEGEVITKSKSFDSYMNYRYGTNAYTGYWSSTKTTEDSFIIRQGFADKLVSPESDNIKISLNNNDILINFYGNDNEYKSFPDVGEYIQDKVICVTRRKDYSTILSDLTNNKLNTINKSTDTPYHTENGKVVDVTIYSNAEYLSTDKCDSQLMRYLVMNKEYRQNIYDTLSKYIDLDCSDDLKFQYAKAKKFVVDNKSYRDGDKKFSNMIIEFKILYSSYVINGNKLVGRYGNKGVVGTILADEYMPFTEHGQVFDIICNPESVIGRLNSGQLFETNSSHIAQCVLRNIEHLSIDEQFEEVLRFIESANAPLADRYRKRTFSKLEKELWIQNMHKRKTIPLEVKPFWSEFGIDALALMYSKFENIKKSTCYVKLQNGDYKELEHPIVGGWQYMMKLKHTPKSKFSVRSVSYVNSKGVPSKSKTYKNNKSLYSTSPIRLGEMEHSILSIGIPYKLVAKLNMEHSSSIEGRKKLNDALYKQNIYKDIHIDMNNSINRNAEILEVFLKTVGLKLTFEKVPKGTAPSIIYNEVIPNVIQEMDLSVSPFKELGGKNEPIEMMTTACK